MTASRVPPPLGRHLPADAQGRETGVLGGGFPPGPVGREDPANTGSPLDSGKPSPKPAPAQGHELQLVGSFPRPSSWTDAKEKALIAADHWFPHTLDFKAVAGQGSIEVTSTWDFLLKIIQAKSPIQRLNFFSHATTGLISMRGSILDDGTNVRLAADADGAWTQIFAKTKAIALPYADTWGDLGENSGTVKVTVDTTQFTLDDVRAKFASDATIWLYLCHGASDPLLFQQVANTFQITAKGFTKEIVYCAPQNFPASRRHKIAVLTTTKPIDSCPNAEADFHKLDSHSNVTTAAPKK